MARFASISPLVFPHPLTANPNQDLAYALQGAVLRISGSVVFSSPSRTFLRNLAIQDTQIFIIGRSRVTQEHVEFQ